MKVGIFTDINNNLIALVEVIKKLKELGCDIMKR